MTNSWKHPLLFMVGAVGCVLLYLFLLNFPPTSLRSPTAGLIPVIVLAATTSLLTSRALRSDGLSAAILGLGAGRRMTARFAQGLLAGVTITGLWMGIITMATGASWEPNPTFNLGALVLASLFHFFNNVGEELVYRGYLFVRLAASWGAVATVVATSGVFALLHLQAGLPWPSVVAAVLTAGLLFGAIFARWRSLPLALGFHVATNIAQDALGLRLGAASLLRSAYPTGGAGRSSVILASIALLNVTVAIGLLFWPHRHGGLTIRSSGRHFGAAKFRR